MPRIDTSELPYPKPAPREKRKRAGDSREHLRLVRALPCLACGRVPAHAHHLMRIGEIKGASRKNEDKWAVPLCETCHDARFQGSVHHSGDEVKWFSDRGIDQIAVAEALWRVSGDLPAMLRISQRART